MMEFEYKTVDVAIHSGRPAIDPLLATMAQDRWRPVTIIAPTEEYPSYSVVFERKIDYNPYDREEQFEDWVRWDRIHNEERRSHE